MNVAVLGARRLFCAAFPFFAAVVVSQAAFAQQLQGRVLLQGETGVENVAVELHRVTRDTAGVVATAVTGAEGTFRVQLPAVDTTGFTVFFATAEYRGVRYFGAPLHPNDPRDSYSVTVFDTLAVAAAADPIRLLRRDMILLPDPQGGWEVNEIVHLANPGAHTLVASAGLPTWEFRIPADAVAFEAGEGEADAARSEIVRMDDRVLLMAPVVPGGREIFVRYRIPASLAAFDIAVTYPVRSLRVFVAQPAPAVAVQGLAQGEPLNAEGQTFAVYEGSQLEPGAVVAVTWRSGAPPFDPTAAALTVAALLLLVGAAAAVRQGNRVGARAAKPVGSDSVPVGAVVRTPRDSEELVG
jgi:hypothetical protein